MYIFKKFQLMYSINTESGLGERYFKFRRLCVQNFQNNPFKMLLTRLSFRKKLSVYRILSFLNKIRMEFAYLEPTLINTDPQSTLSVHRSSNRDNNQYVPPVRYSSNTNHAELPIRNSAEEYDDIIAYENETFRTSPEQTVSKWTCNKTVILILFISLVISCLMNAILVAFLSNTIQADTISTILSYFGLGDYC
jgi:hypothetical protein